MIKNVIKANEFEEADEIVEVEENIDAMLFFPYPRYPGCASAPS